MKKTRVMIVEDSKVVLELLKYIVEQDPRLELAAAVESGEEALKRLDRVSPDVISMDITLPGISGLEATRRIMGQKPTPIVVVSASAESKEMETSMNALRAGALAVLQKPVGVSHDEYQSVADKICTQLFLMSQVKVIRQRWSVPSFRDAKAPASEKRSFVPRPSGQFRMLGVAASTGGPNALVSFFEGLGKDFPLPILLVQHITPSFLEGFVHWLDGVCPLNVVIARDRETPVPGKIYVPPVDTHLVLRDGVLRIDAGPQVSLQRPSGTTLFRSMAAALGSQALAVLLTGMGDDGAEGLLDIRNAGGYTIAEDESTAVVYGMPAAAAKLGAVCEQLPLPEISVRVLELSTGGSSL
jgi:two-component system, chemotaxis family, protein-glutamate methylesterase/glutaminase